MNEVGNTVMAIWSVLALIGLALLVYGLRLERRKFAALGKVEQWLWVRIASIPIFAMTAASVFYSAGAVGGPVALAVFYVLALTAGPLMYFGLHIAMGWLVRPSLTRQESVTIAATGLAALIIGAVFVQVAQSRVFSLALQIRDFQRARADAKPLPHQIINPQRFSIPEAGEVWTEHWKAPLGVKVTRLESAVPSGWARLDDSSPWTLCRDGQDFHVFWPAANGVPRWRMYWQDAAGVEVRSEWATVPATTPVVPFALQWRPDGFVLPVRLPRHALLLGRVDANGKEGFDNLDRLQPGENFIDNCLPLEYRRVNAARESPISSLGVRFWSRAEQQLVFSVLHRPAEDAAPR